MADYEKKCPYYDDHSQLLTKDQIDSVISKTVHQTLVSMGVDTTDPIEMQRDFQSLREWRRTSEAIRSKSLMTLIAFILAGALGALVVGIRTYLKS